MISCKEKVKKAIAAVEQWANEHPQLSVDVAPECEDEWSRDHAIFQFSFHSDDEYCDVGRVLDDVAKIVVKAVGTRFRVIYGHRKADPKEGELILQFHNGLGEIELYRYSRN